MSVCVRWGGVASEKKQGWAGTFDYLETKKTERLQKTKKTIEEAPFISADQMLMAYCYVPQMPDHPMSVRAEQAQQAAIRTCEKMKGWIKVGKGVDMLIHEFMECLHEYMYMCSLALFFFSLSLYLYIAPCLYLSLPLSSLLSHS